MDSVKEQLSACLDGELPAAELDLLLKRLERDPRLRHSMGRYALIGEALRAVRPACASKDFAAQVAAAIQSDAPPHVPSHVTVRRPAIAASAARWLRPAAGMAVAASVAALAIFALQAPDPLMPESVPAGQRIAEATAPAAPQADAVPDNPSYTVPSGTPGPNFVPAARLTNYVVAHSEYSSPLGRRTVLSGVLSADRAEEVGERGQRREAEMQPQR